MDPKLDKLTFPILSQEELAFLRPLAVAMKFGDGEVVFRAGDVEIGLFIVEEGGIEIQNPANDNVTVVTVEPGCFAGDIDVLTGRPVVLTGVAKGRTRLLRIPHTKLRTLLNRVPSFGEKFIVAFTRRREYLTRQGKLGLKVFGAGHCQETNLLREFLYKNFVPYSWIDPETPEGVRALSAYGPPRPRPVVDCGNGQILSRPSLRELAHCAGVWRHVPSGTVDFAIVGAGPAGISAAVYAASEGLSTVLIDSLGPGGQAGGSTKIENFIGFPAGLSGTELATRGVLQMLKFGARMLAPVAVERIEAPPEPGEPYGLHLDCGAVLPARVVLVATGVSWRLLPAKNAARFQGADVHYVCTAVEAALYDDCDVVVVGGGNSAGQATMYLAEVCRKRCVHLLVRSRLESTMAEYLVSRIRAAANVTVHEGTEITELVGEGRLKSAVLARRGSEAPERLACEGVFVFIGAEPAVDWLPKEIVRDKLGFVLTGSDAKRSNCWPLTDRDPCPLETTLPRVLAAGDIRSESTKRVGFAVGDGSLAVACAHQLLSRLRK